MQELPPPCDSLLPFPNLSSSPLNTLAPLSGLPAPSHHAPRMLPSELRGRIGPRPEGTGAVSEQAVLVWGPSRVRISPPPLPPIVRSIHRYRALWDLLWRRGCG